MTGTDGGRQFRPTWLEAVQSLGQHVLTAGGVYQHVTQMPTLNVVRAGVYVVTVNVRGHVFATGATSAFIVNALFKNGSLLNQSEMNPVAYAQDGTTDSQKNFQAAAGISFVEEFAFGDTIDLYSRLTIGGVTANGSGQIISDPNGYNRITMLWIAPPGTTP
jgi:hypothetical protein